MKKFQSILIFGLMMMNMQIYTMEDLKRLFRSSTDLTQEQQVRESYVNKVALYTVKAEQEKAHPESTTTYSFTSEEIAVLRKDLIKKGIAVQSSNWLFSQNR